MTQKEGINLKSYFNNSIPSRAYSDVVFAMSRMSTPKSDYLWNGAKQTKFLAIIFDIFSGCSSVLLCRKGWEDIENYSEIYQQYLPQVNHYIIAPKRKPVLPSAAKTTGCTGMKICMCIVLTFRSDQKLPNRTQDWLVLENSNLVKFTK